MRDILEKIKKIVSERAGVEKEDIKPDSYFNDDLNVNDIELEEIIALLEDEYKIELDLELAEVKSVADLMHAIHDKID